MSTGSALAMRLISTGHFVGQTDLAAGRYRLAVDVPAVSPSLSTSFSFRLRAGPGGGG